MTGLPAPFCYTKLLRKNYLIEADRQHKLFAKKQSVVQVQQPLIKQSHMQLNYRNSNSVPSVLQKFVKSVETT
jgi:hypothetical protein